mmetsp:Transcript_15332/g.31739  ORF Transcript_15332/g.31739 Transcript_15332/m.31739 type:complete len:116 (-) Transcript_15332:1127-1474(-)
MKSRTPTVIIDASTPHNSVYYNTLITILEHGTKKIASFARSFVDDRFDFIPCLLQSDLCFDPHTYRYRLEQHECRTVSYRIIVICPVMLYNTTQRNTIKCSALHYTMRTTLDCTS